MFVPELAAAVLIAFAVDRYYGEPPVPWHTVVWMGNYLNLAAKYVLPEQEVMPGVGDIRAFSRGTIAWTTGAVMVFTVACTLQWCLLQLPAVLGALLLGVALKPLLAWRMLRREVLAVEAALAESLEAGRQRLSWLVSRDVSTLSEAQVRESAIETLAENLNDSVVAPIFWFVLLGLPGAAVYRFANTADAMWGYHGRWEWAGKWAARADDVLSWLPARLTALLLMLVFRLQETFTAHPELSPVRPELDEGLKLTSLRQEARRTPSPNSGWPMAAMALGLGVRLGKPGAYVLHAAGRVPEAKDTFRAVNSASKTAVALCLLSLSAIYSIAWMRAS